MTHHQNLTEHITNPGDRIYMTKTVPTHTYTTRELSRASWTSTQSALQKICRWHEHSCSLLSCDTL